jgi:hypothetical protein
MVPPSTNLPDKAILSEHVRFIQSADGNELERISAREV